MGDFLFTAAVFLASFLVGYYLILRIPALLHTPLMSMTNAISAATVLGAVMLFAQPMWGMLKFLGLIAVMAAAFNVVGGFAVTDRMLRLFKAKEVRKDRM
jgi:H+-translocating NAD(P) transhydrogenase subunit alpha